jgi:hypothetical protein
MKPDWNSHQKERSMNLHLNLTVVPVISLLAGVLILVQPRLLNYVVAFYLIAVGVFGLIGR